MFKRSNTPVVPSIPSPPLKKQNARENYMINETQKIPFLSPFSHHEHVHPKQVRFLEPMVEQQYHRHSQRRVPLEQDLQRYHFPTQVPEMQVPAMQVPEMQVPEMQVPALQAPLLPVLAPVVPAPKPVVAAQPNKEEKPANAVAKFGAPPYGTMFVDINRNFPEAREPFRLTHISPIYQLHAAKEYEIAPNGGRATVDVGCQCLIPPGLIGIVKGKPDLASQHGILVAEEALETMRRSTISLTIFNFEKTPFHIKAKDHIAIMIILPCATPHVEQTSSVYHFRQEQNALSGDNV